MTSEHDETATAEHGETDEKRFHGWRLLGVVILVVASLGVISAIVDWIVIGPLEGRAF